MKSLAPILLFITALIPLKAAQELKNSDFTDGLNGWEGDVEMASTAEDALAAPTLGETAPSQAPGVVIKLSRTDWTHVTQDFVPKAGQGTLTIVYKFSDDLAFSSNSKDYVNMPTLLGLGVEPFNITPGHFLAMFFAPTKTKVFYIDIAPETGSPSQTFKTQIKHLARNMGETLYLAFPPGEGTVTLLQVGLEGGKLAEP
jgi:hypothetical protein